MTKKYKRRLNELTLSKLCRDLGLSYNLTAQYVSKELKHKQNELNKYIDRIVKHKTNKVIIFKPEAIEYFRLKKSSLQTINYKSNIKEYYLKGIDVKTTAKELKISNITVRRNYALIESNASSAKERLKDPESLVGLRIGRMLILKNLGYRETGKYFDKLRNKSLFMKTRFYLCKCIKCGTEKENRLSNIGLSGCKKCGYKKANCTSKHPVYPLWMGIISRNYEKLKKGSKERVCKGILICDRWLLNFYDFLEDIGERPSPEYVFGRIDRNKGFTPDNCKWMTKAERSITLRNHKLRLANIAEEAGLSRERIRQIAEQMLLKNDNEFNNLIERIDYSSKCNYKQIIFKPEALEYFKQKKYLKKSRTSKLRILVKEQYLKGKDMETVAKLIGKPINSIIRYYKIFSAETLDKDS